MALVITPDEFIRNGEHGNQFYAEYRGYDLKAIPDIPIVCRPLVNTSTHQLALETSPVWCLRVKHRGSWRTKTSPKVSIYADGVAKDRIGFSFRIPARSLYTKPEQVWNDLMAMDFTLRNRNLMANAVQRESKALVPAYYIPAELDECAMLMRFNAERDARQKARLPDPLPDVESNVVDLVALLRERGIQPDVDVEQPLSLMG